MCASQDGREIEVGKLDGGALALQQSVFVSPALLGLPRVETMGAIILIYFVLIKSKFP